MTFWLERVGMAAEPTRSDAEFVTEVVGGGEVWRLLGLMLSFRQNIQEM